MKCFVVRSFRKVVVYFVSVRVVGTALSWVGGYLVVVGMSLVGIVVVVRTRRLWFVVRSASVFRVVSLLRRRRLLLRRVRRLGFG